MAHLQGSFDGEGHFEPGLIGRGMRLRFLLGGERPVTTSRVITIHVNRPVFIQPMSSSIH
jgi:hypothetical protein